MKKLIFDSKGNIEPWGRDFWTESFIGEFLIIFGGTIFTVSILGLIIYSLIKYL